MITFDQPGVAENDTDVYVEEQPDRLDPYIVAPVSPSALQHKQKEPAAITSQPSGASPFDRDYHANEIDGILRQNDEYILAMARKKVPRHIASPEVLDLEIQELAQKSRIKLWKALQQRHITHIEAYIRCIVHSASIDMIRNSKSDLPLPLDEEGELYQGNVNAGSIV